MEHNRIIYERPIYDSEIEYIQNSNSLEAIDSLFVIPATATSLKIEAKFCFTNHTRYQALCGYQNDGFTTPSLYLFYSQNTTAKTFYIGSTTQRTDELNVDLPDNFIFDGSFTMQNGIATVYGNNGSINKSTTYNNNLWKGGSYSLIVMGGRVGASHIGEDTGIMKLYKFSLTVDNMIVRDFIPVRKGQTGYLYDKITKRLYGAISGNFILGPDVSNPVPNIRRVFRFGNKRCVMPMPYDSKIEYLESSGNQYIDTGHILNGNDKVDIVYDRLGYGIIFGSRSSYNTKECSITNESGNNHKYYIKFGITGQQQIIYESNTQPTGTVSVHIESGDIKVNGTTVSTALYGSNFFNGNCFLFLINQNGSAYSGTQKFPQRIRSFKIEGILDLIPVRRGNVGYMYDKVSGKLFGNAGTGQFILGNDIND